MNDDKIYELVEEINSISKLINSKKGIGGKHRKFTITTLMIMNQLRIGNVKTLTELSETLGIPNSTVSVVVDKLVKLGIVRRERDEKDRRKVLIYIEDEGLQQEKQIIKYRIEYFKDLFKDASDEEIDCILKGLKVLEKFMN
ncbi:MarR family winged helix-turn-helix transcriptional regulator [Clostridium sp. JS66]|uniref:MarR family winged helix-turn-helix transcriptional regulator n=1 Tax=Clostridium sp. JS66 TaxID=3064705 RepID=UPI00298D92BD|nr:MarR family transcriptional regulator [Clostridium sp. JS66]WPC42252.1 MarR family transcriptional regulator [Clostridium sp. JS66]